MKPLKILLTGMMMLFCIVAISQTKKLRKPPPKIKMEEPKEPQKVKSPAFIYPPKPPIPPPPPSDINGHPWTRNGQKVWVVKPPKPVQLPKPPIPPPPEED